MTWVCATWSPQEGRRPCLAASSVFANRVSYQAHFPVGDYCVSSCSEPHGRKRQWLLTGPGVNIPSAKLTCFAGSQEASLRLRSFPGKPRGGSHSQGRASLVGKLLYLSTAFAHLCLPLGHSSLIPYCRGKLAFCDISVPLY